MKYIDKTGLTHLKNIIRQETKTEIEKVTNKVLPVNFYKFSSEDEMYEANANDGDIGIFCGEVEENITEKSIINNIIIKNRIQIFTEVPEGKKYYFFDMLGNKKIEVITSPAEIKIIVAKQNLGTSTVEPEKTFIYQPVSVDSTNYDYTLTSGQAGEIKLSSNTFFPAYKNENKWDDTLFYVMLYKKKKAEMYIHKENTASGVNGWEPIVTVDNEYVTEGRVEYLIQEALNNSSQ